MYFFLEDTSSYPLQGSEASNRPVGKPQGAASGWRGASSTLFGCQCAPRLTQKHLASVLPTQIRVSLRVLWDSEGDPLKTFSVVTLKVPARWYLNDAQGSPCLPRRHFQTLL